MLALSSSSDAHLSWNLWSDIHQLLTFHFMVNALRAGTITAVAAGVIGWFMILRQQTFAGHTLAVVGFPGAAAAIWAGVAAAWGYFGFCIAASLIIALTGVRRDPRGFSDESAVIGTVQAYALACGLLFVALYKGFLNSLTSLLFGSFLGVTDHQVVVLLIVAAGAVAAVAVVGRPLFFASVDPDVAAAQGVPVRFLAVMFLVLMGVAAAEISQITGSLLVFALLVMPAAAARQITARPGLSLVLSVTIALAVTWIGMGIAYFSVYPVGFFITTVGFSFYLAATAGRAFADRRGRLHLAVTAG
jgi:zinc/manganese transport system permease protein